MHCSRQSGEKALTESEVAEHFGISHHTLRQWRRTRTGPRFLKVGRSVRYLPGDVEAYLAGCAVETSR